MDITGNIKLTHEEETEQSTGFLDMKIHHTNNRHIKIQIYRKPTHGPISTMDIRTPHKRSAVRTLHKCAAITTDPEDRALEEKHIQDALKKCSYPQWQ